VTIIFLNGCTSAGKSSLARALQQRLPGAWLRIGIDDGFAMLGSRYAGHPQGYWFESSGDGRVQLHLGAAGLQALAAYRRAAAAIAAGGADLIIDEVLLAPSFLDDWRRVLPDVPTLMVGVHCNLAELERREKARGDRVIGQARGQFDHVHGYAAYDLEVDTGEASIDACADVIATRLGAA
jgi:chloramphenicol 3-O phosphotransferase